MEYCQANNVDAVEVGRPTFLDLDNTSADWQKKDLREVMMVKPLSLIPLLQVLFDTITLRKGRYKKGFLFVCEDEIIEVNINDTGATVVEVDEWLHNLDHIVVRASSSILLEIIFEGMGDVAGAVVG